MKARKKPNSKSITSKTNDVDNAIFQTLCEIARERNAARFHTMYYEFEQKTGLKLTFDYLISEQAGMHDRKTVIRQMAEEGNHDAVNFLIKEFGVKANKAVEGYARIGNVEKVNQYLLDDNFRNDAARGYAFAGNVEQVEKLIRCGINLVEPAYGYGRAGNLDEAKKLFDRYKSTDNSWKIGVFAAEGFAHSKLYKQTQDFILHAAGGVPENKNDVQKFFAKLHKQHNDFARYCNSALAGFALTGCFFNHDEMLKLLALTDNDGVRGFYISFLTEDKYMKRSFEVTTGDSIENITKQADNIRKTMLDQSLAFADARKFLDDQAAAEKAKQDAEAAAAAEKALAEAEAAVKEPAPVAPAVEPAVTEAAAPAPAAEVAKANKLEEAKNKFIGIFRKHKGQEAVEKKEAAATAEGDNAPAPAPK